MSGVLTFRHARGPACLIIGLSMLVASAGTVDAQARVSRVPGVVKELGQGLRVGQSRNFHLTTDLSTADAEELLGRLETMLRFVSAYWGRPNRKPIEMYVFDDITRWPPEVLLRLDPSGLNSVRGGGGLTITSVRGIVGGPKIDAQAVVYADSRHGTPQHEAVHAYCGTTFGSLGPVWYAEGMAEVGSYWRENEKGVKASQYVIDYMQSVPPKPLNDIVNNPLETTGDSWKNYAWRWALCHLLGFNENYSGRFKPLGLALLSDRKVNFWTVYGPQAAEIEFEYRLFIQDMTPGFRCDLCSWDWKTAHRKLTGNSQAVARIRADRGWQASRVTVVAGTEYAITCEGEWQCAPAEPGVSSAGNDQGRGQLIGVIFGDYKLGDVINLGGRETFIAPSDGDLYVRCRDDWGSLADNSGTISLKIKLHQVE